MNRRSIASALRTAFRRAGGWIAREPIGALGLLIMLVWSVVAVGAIGDGGGWLGIGRYDANTIFQRLNHEFVYVQAAAALNGESAEISVDELSALLADPDVYGPFADAADAQPLIQEYIQPLIADGSLIPQLASGREPYIVIEDGEVRRVEPRLIRANARPLTVASLEGPSTRHWFGTDRSGRDIYANLIDTAWHGLFIGFLAALLGVGGGLLVALVARPISRGPLGGALDATVRTLLDGLLAIPLFLLLLLVAVVQGSTTFALALPLAGFALPLVWRAFRDEPDSRELALQLVLIFRNVMIVALLCEAALSFFGLGPAHGSWGYLIGIDRQIIVQAPWLTVISGLALTSLLLGVFALTHGLRRQVASSTR